MDNVDPAVQLSDRWRKLVPVYVWQAVVTIPFEMAAASRSGVAAHWVDVRPTVPTHSVSVGPGIDHFDARTSEVFDVAGGEPSLAHPADRGDLGVEAVDGRL